MAKVEIIRSGGKGRQGGFDWFIANITNDEGKVTQHRVYGDGWMTPNQDPKNVEGMMDLWVKHCFKHDKRYDPTSGTTHTYSDKR